MNEPIFKLIQKGEKIPDGWEPVYEEVETNIEDAAHQNPPYIPLQCIIKVST